MFIPKEKPPFVYKYCSAVRALQIIQDLTFYFAPAAQLNDLFEFRVGSLYDETQDSKYRVYGKRLVADGWYTDLAEAVETAKSLDPTDIDSAYSFFIDGLRATLVKVMKYSGVCCFTSERNNQRMWGTYGDNHAGAVLEFSTDPNLSRFAAHLMPVIYTNTKLPLCPSELMTDKLTLDQRLLSLFLCIKHVHWRDECEWRLLLLADSEQSARDRIAGFQRRAFARIFLGPRMSSENESSIRNAASRHKPAIPVFKRQVDDVFAKEEYTGFEVIDSVDQLLYWAKAKEPR